MTEEAGAWFHSARVEGQIEADGISAQALTSDQFQHNCRRRRRSVLDEPDFPAVRRVLVIKARPHVDGRNRGDRILLHIGCGDGLLSWIQGAKRDAERPLALIRIAEAVVGWQR